MSWRQAPGERVRQYAQYIEDNFHNPELIECPNIGWHYPESKSQWLNHGLQQDVYQEIPEYVWNSGFSWEDIVDRAEDAEWLIDLYCQNSRIGQYEYPNERYYRNDFTFDRDGYVIVYTDGSCLGNGRNDAKGGIGVWFGNGHNW